MHGQFTRLQTAAWGSSNFNECYMYMVHDCPSSNTDKFEGVTSLKRIFITYSLASRTQLPQLGCVHVLIDAMEAGSLRLEAHTCALVFAHFKARCIFL